MFGAKVLLFLAAGASASILAERVALPMGAIEARTVLQGWSLQASTCPAGSKSCPTGACCPTSLNCNPAGNLEVVACCTSGDCRGAVEGAPSCADSSWNLWKGLNGNGFCCLPGQVGIYDFHNPTAGTCVSSAPADATLAVLMSTGSGAIASATTAATTAASSSTAAPVTSASSVASSASSVASSASSVASTAATAASNATITGATSTTTAVHSGVEKAGMSLVALTIALVAMLVL